MPSWQRPSVEALEAAAQEQRPLVVWFMAEDDTDNDFSGKELAEISKTSAVFIKVPPTTDREKSPWAVDSVVPVNKLTTDNPAREYSIPVGKSTIVIADSWGNEYYRVYKAPTHKALEGYLTRITSQVTKANEKLQKNLDKAKEAKEKANRKGALSAIMKNFKDGQYGLPAQEETVRLYHEILDAARTEIGELADKGDADGLKAMAKEFKKTDLEKEIDEALSKLS